MHYQNHLSLTSFSKLSKAVSSLKPFSHKEASCVDSPAMKKEQRARGSNALHRHTAGPGRNVCSGPVIGISAKLRAVQSERPHG